MIPGAIEGADFVLAAPNDSPPVGANKVLGLPVKRVEHEELGTFLHSAWVPNADEIRGISAGAPVILAVRGPGHPVVLLSVAKPSKDVHEAPRERIDVVQLALKVGATLEGTPIKDRQEGVPHEFVDFTIEELNLFAQSIQVMCFEQWNMEHARRELAVIGETEAQLREEYDRIEAKVYHRSNYVSLDYLKDLGSKDDEPLHDVDGKFTTRQLEILVKLARLRRG